MRRIALQATLACAILAAVPRSGHAADTAAANPATSVRVGDHAGYSRIVFDLPPAAGVHVVTEGQRVLLVFTGAGTVIPPDDLPRNLSAIRTGIDTATLDLAPGAKARPIRIGDRLVIDVLDPGGRSSARPATPSAAKLQPSKPAAPRTAADPGPELAAVPPEPPRPAPAPATSELVRPTERALAPSPLPIAAPSEPVTSEPLPAPVNSITPPPPAQVQPVFVRADSDVGAAAFRRGGFGVVVLDRRLADQPVPPGAAWTKGAISTVLQIPLLSDQVLRLTRSGPGWTIDRAAPLSAGPALSGPIGGGLQLAVGRPGRRVAVLDPISGSTLLVGTSLDGASSTSPGRRTPGYRLLPSWTGVVIEPASDQVDLRSNEGGFLLTGDALAPVPAGSSLSRRLDLPSLPSADLLNRLHAQLASAADAPPRARSKARLEAVQSMIALGLGAEAQGLSQLVAADDPQESHDAQTGALSAIAAILAGRPGEAGQLNDSRLDGTDEIALWRGLRDRRLDTDSPAARRVGELAPLVLSYPAPLQRVIWPDVAEAAVQAGVSLPIDRLPPFAQALLLDRGGRVDEAIAAYDRVAAGQDRLDQVRASARAAELRLAAGQITPAEAAAVMERQSFAWRGDARELGFRLRAAELMAAAQQWRPALEALRAIEAYAPEQKASIQSRKAGVMQAMLTAEGSGLSALDLVLLASDYADCVPEGPAGSALARLLADKLAALDLPSRAIPVLQGLMRATQPGEARAEFGARLGQLLFEGGDTQGAMASLEASRSPDLAPAVQERRGLLQARLEAANGDINAAASGLAQLGTEHADDLRATLLAKAGDWSGSLRALQDLATKTIPAQGSLTDAAQDVLIRQADAAAQAGDPATLRTLRASLGRLTAPRAEVFRLLTAAPVDTYADLPRGRVELAAARDLPQHLRAQATR